MKESKKVELVVFVPESHAEAIRKAMGDAGAGVIGNYTYCFSSSKSTGDFKPQEGSNPSIGKIGKQKSVEEIRIETLCGREKVEAVINTISAVHPYEEAPVDIYPMLEI